MIAEDEADIRNLVATMAQVWGHTSVTFESGHKAWEFLDSVTAGSYSEPLPGFALMDIRMPGYRGDEVAKRIRQTIGMENIPIVLMTAFILGDDEIRAMKAEFGIDHVINKPFADFMELKSTLESVIEKKKRENA
jgi:CheY-like chemotaxis protein